MIVERTRWLPVRDARIASLAEGMLLPVRVGDRRLVLVRQQGSLFALADHCPHQGRALSGGWVEEGHVVCPWHRMQFAISTGKARHGTCSNTEAFEVREEVGGCTVAVPYTTFRVFGIDLW
jgi:3-phenylpropionate/trans-cinnamate dioxygenase ferredoxin subunit